jgi:inosine-uridine nucleoside N-ribohydrolase
MSKKIIFDTDMGVDCDDAVALAILLNKHKKGEIELLAVTASSTREGATATVQAILDFYGVSVPVGAMAQPAIPCDETNNYARAVMQKYCTKDSEKDAVTLLRETLSAQTEKITFVAVGPLSNVARLLETNGDEISPLSGVELVKEKVDILYCMGGAFAQNFGESSPLPKSIKCHAEWNILQDISAAKTFVTACPVEIRFVPFECGILAYTLDKPLETPVYDSMKGFANSPFTGPGSFLPDGTFRRPSWDPVTCLCATEDCSEYFELSPLGLITVEDDGETVYTQTERGGNGRFYILKENFEGIADRVNASIDPG